MTEPSITSAAPAHTPTSLPADDHTHSRFSWDSFHGNVRASCEHALAIGLPALSFTEHVDLTVGNAPPDGWAWDQGIRGSYDDPIGPGGHGHFTGAPLGVDAHQAAIEDCRHRFPDLTIHTPEDTRAPGEHLLVDHAKDQHSPVDLLAAYLGQVEAVVASDGPFEVLGHIDFSLRQWTPGDGPSPWGQVEEQTRHVVGVLAASGRVPEVNTSIPLDLRVVRWWHEAGGTAVSFGR
jgi:histidinol-phosphatase (PHP family)